MSHDDAHAHGHEHAGHDHDHGHGHAGGCACCAPAPAAATTRPTSEDPVERALAYAKARDWRRAAAALEPIARAALRDEETGVPIESGKLAFALRLGAAAQEQLGNNERAGDIWEAFFRRAAPGQAPAVLADHLNLVRVRAKSGTLDAATRRRFEEKLARAGREGAVPRDHFLKLVGIYRGLSGRGHLQAGEPGPAFEALGRALWHVKRHSRLYETDKTDIAGFHACLEEAGEEAGLQLWRGRAVETLSVESWTGRA